MIGTRLNVIVLVVLAGVLASACSPGQPFGPTVTPSATPTPTATNTPAPTNTPTPMDTSTPSATPTPTIGLGDPIAAHLSDVAVTGADWFDTLSASNWDCGNGSFQVRNGALVVAGDSYSGCSRLTTYHEGEGVLISFMMDPGSNFEFYFDDRLGEWATRTYKRYGLAGGSRTGFEISNFVGKTNVGPKIRSPKSGIRYNLLLAIGEGPKFLLVLWQHDDPSTAAVYSKAYPDWTWCRMETSNQLLLWPSSVRQLRRTNFFCNEVTPRL